MVKSNDWRELYPFASHYLTLDGNRYHYLDEGDGPILLMVHGNPTWSFYWRHLVTAFRDRFRVIVPDHMGCGLSDKPANYPYVLSQHVFNLTRLIERLDLGQVTLFGHDWGGAIGLGAATEMPDRFSRLVLFNTAAFRSTQIPLRIQLCRTPLLGRLAVQGFNGFARAALRMATNHPERFTAAVREGYVAPYDRWGNRIATYQFVADIPLRANHRSFAALAEIEAGLAKLKDLPTQLIWGMQDWCFTPAFLDRLAEFFPAAEIHRIADAGHYVVEDAHERIVPLVNSFLTRHVTADV